MVLKSGVSVRALLTLGVALQRKRDSKTLAASPLALPALPAAAHINITIERN
jgi:hypothetical protein